MYRAHDPIAETTRATLRGQEPALINELTRRRFLSAGAAAKVLWLYTQFGLADRTQMEYFNGGHGGHAINGQGSFEFLARHLA